MMRNYKFSQGKIHNSEEYEVVVQINNNEGRRLCVCARKSDAVAICVAMYNEEKGINYEQRTSTRRNRKT